MLNAFTGVFVTALAAALATRLWLAERQVRYVRAHRAAVPPAFAESIPLAAHQTAADYTVAKSRLAMVDALLDAAVLLILTLGGLLQFASEQWARVTGHNRSGTASR
jgi:STE24 endopeptidase